MARISYVDPDQFEDSDIRAFFDEARTFGTPRPEAHAIRGHHPEILRWFMWFWKHCFKNGLVDLPLKELVRLRIATALTCSY